MTLVALFTTAIDLTGPQRFLLMLPLCLSLAVVYKTMRLEDVRAIPAASLILSATIVLAMCALAVGLWAVFSIMV
jgi:hypothetical protein